MKLVERGYPSDPVKIWKEDQKQTNVIIQETTDDDESRSETSSVSSTSSSSSSGPDYGYLLNMAIRSLSEEKKDELLKQRDNKVGLIISRTARTVEVSKFDIFCVDVMYSGEYDACNVTLSVYPHWASLKNMPVHGGNRTYDLWNTRQMLCQLSYAVRSVRVCDISEQNLVPSILM